MAAIKLDILKPTTIKTGQSYVDSSLTPVPQFSYQDLSLDLQVGNSVGTAPTPNHDKTDIQVSYDFAAIVNSIENIFNSMPGQWLLNPAFGIGLPRFLFQPIDTFTGDQIAQAIIQNLTVYEPRCSIAKIQVQGDPDNNLYNIVLALQVPGVSNSGQQLKGTLTSSSFKFLA